MNEINISSSKIFLLKNKQKDKFHPFSSKMNNKKSLFRVLSTGNINNPNLNYSKKINIYKNYSFLPSLNSTNNFKVKIKKNILNNSLPKKNNYKIEIEKLYDLNTSYKKTILKLQSELNMIYRDTAQKEDELLKMNKEIENIISEYEYKYDLNVIGQVKLEEKNKYVLIRKMKNKIKEEEQELKEEISKNKILRKNEKFTKFNEIKLENAIINSQKEKIELLIENSKQLKNNQNKELNQNIMYNNNLESQKNLINNMEEKINKLNKEEKFLKNEILKYEDILNKTNDNFKIIKLKQYNLKDQNMKLNKEKNEFRNERNKKNKNINEDINNINKLEDIYSLEKLKKKLYRAKCDYNYNKMKNQKTMEKLVNIKKGYNSSLEQYKKIENNFQKMQVNKNDNKNNIIIAKDMNDEEKVSELKKIYQENRDKENELEKYLSSYQEAIQKMNNGENIDIDEIRKNILKIIENNENFKNNGNLFIQNSKNIVVSSKNSKKDENSNNDLILSKNNPYCTNSINNNPIISNKLTNQQFRQFTYVLFKNLESKKINYEKGKNEIVIPLINYYNKIINEKMDNEKTIDESNIQEKLSSKFTEIILNLLNCNSQQDSIRLKIFFNAIYFDKVNNAKDNNNKINIVSNFFLSLFNYTHEYTSKDEELLKQRIKSKYNDNFLKLKKILIEYMLSKNKKNNNQNNDYLSIEEIKNILDNNTYLRLKERYIEYIIFKMKQFDDNKASLFDLKISNLDQILNEDEINKNEENEENGENDEKENKSTESIEEVSPEDYNNNIYSALVIIRQLMRNENKDLRKLFVDSIVTISKPKSDVITLDSFNDELNKRNVNLSFLQMSCINNRYCINEELHALDIKQIENDIKNLKDNEINNYL